MNDIWVNIIISVLLLYPCALGFYFGGNAVKRKAKIQYAVLGVLLAITNLIVVMASLSSGLLYDSLFNIVSFYLLQAAILAATIIHIFTIMKKKYAFKYIRMFAVAIFIFGLAFCVSLIVFSNPANSAEDGIDLTNALIVLVPTLLATAFFTLAGSDKNTFEIESQNIEKHP